ncbi:MAG: hypothetical protein ACXVBN_00415 [Flavisolibacter sp.]
MQFKQTLVRLLVLLVPIAGFSQTTYLSQGAQENILLERLEIMAQTDSILNFSKIRPFSTKQVIPVIEKYYASSHPDSGMPEQGAAADTTAGGRVSPLSPVDAFNAQMALMGHAEWTNRQFTSRKRFLKNFYQTPASFYQVNTKDFFLAVNPVFQYYVGKEQGNDQQIFLNTRGLTLRGRIANKIGFAAYVTDNQERDPLYVQQWVEERKAVPGEGFYKDFKTTGYDYFDARGYISFNAAGFIDISFGYDKNFIGNGYRSLFLSDFSNSALFLKINTRIWKFNYQNLFMELQNAERFGADILIPKKYAALHHLDIGITRWLNLGVFEGVVFGRKDHFEFGYLNPVIFYRSIEQQNGSFDNSVAGLDFKANAAHHFQFYGQLLLDEFKLSEIKANRGWWGNKYAFQLGAKYINAFQVKNLDLQLETNRIRPFTYSHRDSVANYTHYNQPLAHPQGANLQEFIGLARYQPAPRWLIQGKVIYYMQGKDTGLTSFGSNIFLPNVPPYRTSEYGYGVGSGVKNKIAYASLLLSYQLKPNFFLEMNAVYRKQDAPGLSENTSVIYAGVRWNMHRREFDF